MRIRPIAVVVLAALGLVPAQPHARAQDASPYIRVVDVDDQEIRLDIAIRTLAPHDQNHPVVHLVGAVHIADAPFYTNVQSFLDVHDIVLYEGVGGGFGKPVTPVRGEEAKRETTERRVLFLAMLGKMLEVETGDHPTETAQLADAFDGSMRKLVEIASRDAWGNRVVIRPERFDAVSLGADGKPGGQGTDADLSGMALLENPPVITPDPRADGLQRDLADALGLTFQLDGVDYSRAHWRNSDLNFGEIQEALGGPPASPSREAPVGEQRSRDDVPQDERTAAADMLFETLSGESFLAKASGFLLRMIGSTPQGQALVKIMLAETLTQAEALLEMQPGPIGDLLEVIIDDRNAAVVRDLGAIVDDEPDAETIAIFYGAGHFGDLEARIENELGYDHQSTIWIPAMTIDLEAAGLGSREVAMYRGMMRNMLKAQMEIMRER